MILNYLEVFKCPGIKKRLGKDNDGGYIIVKDNIESNNNYDILISAGISDDISFEIDFLREFENVNTCFAYDNTISEIPICNDPFSNKIQYIPKNISSRENESDKLTNLHNLLTTYKDIFLKMDIEGSEYEFFNSLDLDKMRSLKQIVVEFHYPCINEAMWSILGRLTETHWLVHLHPNNNCGINTFKCSNDQNIIVPNVFECTYIRKDYLERSTEPIPNVLLDMPNKEEMPEIVLSGYPYN